MQFLEVTNISKLQQGVLVVNEVSFSQQPFQKLAIAGETGSGKSTLLKMAGGLIQPDSGEARFEGVRVKGPLEVLLPGHPGIAYLSQHFELRNQYRVEEILAYVNQLTQESADEVYEICRITHLLKRRTDALSGGEKQRIALARLLITAPKLLLLDEPFSNLDMIHKGILKSVIRDIGNDLGITCTLISHDPQDILSWADEILIMKEGKILQQGPPEDVYQRPVNEYAAALLGRYNLMSPAQARSLDGLPGIHLNGRHLFIRPENFILVPENGQAPAGKVNKVSFWGGYHELEVLLPEGAITLRATHPQVKAGDIVHVSVAPGGVWYL